MVKIVKEQKTRGGIILVDNSVEHLAKEEGIVMELGPDVFIDSGPTTEAQVKIGDTVVFARYAGKQLTPDDGQGNELRVMRDVDIHCVVEEIE